jgi:hypothetical protein
VAATALPPGHRIDAFLQQAAEIDATAVFLRLS